MIQLRPSHFYLSHALHSLAEGAGFTPEAREAVKRANPWHKFILDPEMIGDKFAPADYADDLLAHGLFNLPFDNLVIWMGPLSDPKLMFEDVDDGLSAAEIVLVSKQNDTLTGRFYEVTIRPKALALKPGSGRYNFPLSMSRKEWVSAKGFYELDELEKNESYVKDGHLMLANAVSNEPIHAEEYMRVEKDRFLIPIFELVGFLNAEGIVDQYSAAPKFINKKRESSGKPPLISYHLLTVDRAKVKMPGVVSAGGTHASPRLHWRRGHVRRLSTGKVVAVRPCLVGDVSRGGVFKDYTTH